MNKGMRKPTIIVLIILIFMLLLSPLSLLAIESWEYDPANGATYSTSTYPSRFITIQSGITGYSCTLCEEAGCALNPSQLLATPIQTINAIIGQLVAADATGTKVLVTSDDFGVCSNIIYPWLQ